MTFRGNGGGSGRGGSGGGMGRNRSNAGLGGGGQCVCTGCGASVAHQRGIPCYEMKCPKCGAALTRDGLVNQNSSANKPSVQESSCIGCTRCVSVCPHNAITMVDRKAVINHDLCTACGKCIAACPVGAIK